MSLHRAQNERPYGCLAGHPDERIYRDIRLCQIYEGTSEIPKINISRELAKAHSS